MPSAAYNTRKVEATTGEWFMLLDGTQTTKTLIQHDHPQHIQIGLHHLGDPVAGYVVFNRTVIGGATIVPDGERVFCFGSPIVQSFDVVLQPIVP